MSFFHSFIGGIRDHLSEEEVMADYLLWRLNNFGNFR
jgi:hypothetical protein